MKFSIATPTWNSLPMLRKCVGAVRGQTYGQHEHVVQDGASTDGTVEWLSGQQDLVWQSEKDGGMYEAINAAWARSTGDVLSWLNADEQYLPNTLERVAAEFETRPEVDVVWGNAIIVDAAGDPVSVRQDVPVRAFYLRNDTLYLLSCTIFYRRRLWDDGALRLDEQYKHAADKDVVLRLIQRGYTFRHIPAFLSLFTIGENIGMDPLAQQEGLDVHMRHGGTRSKTVRAFVANTRKCEKLLRGCYRRPDLSYDYVLDDTPTYRHVMKKGVHARLSREQYLNWGQET